MREEHLEDVVNIIIVIYNSCLNNSIFFIYIHSEFTTVFRSLKYFILTKLTII